MTQLLMVCQHCTSNLWATTKRTLAADGNCGSQATFVGSLTKFGDLQQQQGCHMEKWHISLADCLFAVSAITSGNADVRAWSVGWDTCGSSCESQSHQRAESLAWRNPCAAGSLCPLATVSWCVWDTPLQVACGAHSVR